LKAAPSKRAARRKASVLKASCGVSASSTTIVHLPEAALSFCRNGSSGSAAICGKAGLSPSKGSRRIEPGSMGSPSRASGSVVQRQEVDRAETLDAADVAFPRFEAMIYDELWDFWFLEAPGWLLQHIENLRLRYSVTLIRKSS
jgi:hypothetical protein